MWSVITVLLRHLEYTADISDMVLSTLFYAIVHRFSTEEAELLGPVLRSCLRLRAVAETLQHQSMPVRDQPEFCLTRALGAMAKLMVGGGVKKLK